MAVVAWDCADDAYRERAYNHMAAEIERLEAIIADQRGLVRDLTAVLEKRNVEVKHLETEVRRLATVYGDFLAAVDAIAFGNWADGHDSGEIVRQLERRISDK